MKKDVRKRLHMYADWMVFNGDLFPELFHSVTKSDDTFLNFIHFSSEICYLFLVLWEAFLK